MKETVRSLRIYLVLSGALGLFSNIAQLAQQIRSTSSVMINLLFAALCASLLFCGARLKTLIVGNPKSIVAVLHAGIGLNLAFIALLLWVGGAAVPIARSVLGVLLLMYLRANVLRLAGDEATRPVSAAA